MANNDVQHLLDMLYEMIDGAKNAPLTSDKCILNRDEALDLLDEIRAQLPVELSRAQELIRAKEDYVKAAKRDVERMMQQAEQDAKNKVSETEVLGIAREKSHEIIKRPRTARAKCTAWPTSTPRMRCAAPRRPSGWRSRRSSSPACASAPPLPSRCRSAARSWHSQLKSRYRTDKILSKVTKTDMIGRHNLYLGIA